ncbi:tetratricopeptide repeat protein [Aequorivita echinoideorum]|uniref:Tetratricopeptide repeat protein n=1 Tax=Aequorivita echinoideorum TaxID=1549647 RepID=A0ABS5S3B3_9FLAO|nr:tetratricopeptide repeat protein [Aequorivita echinoideorum]
MTYIVFLFLLSPFIAIAQSDFQRAETYFEQEKFSKAQPIFEKFLQQNPSDKKTREYLGDIASYEKDWDTAIEYYKALAAEEDNNANYHFKYGGALGMKALSISKVRALAYIPDIKRELERAADLDKKHIEARWALVELYMQLPGIVGGSEEKAQSFANQLSKISAVDGYLASGYIAEYSKRPEEAEKFYKKAIEIGGSPHTYEKLSNLYETNNQPNKALETTATSLKKHKRNQLNYQIGKIAAQYNIKPHYGIECLYQYLADYSVKDGVPRDWAYYRLAQIYKNLGKKEIALTWINKALLERNNFEEAKKEKSLILAL